MTPTTKPALLKILDALHQTRLKVLASAAQEARDYVERRTQQGLTKREIIRCLKRYVGRELLPLIREALDQPGPTPRVDNL